MTYKKKIFSLKSINVFFLSATVRYRTASLCYPSWIMVVENGVTPKTCVYNFKMLLHKTLSRRKYLSHVKF